LTKHLKGTAIWSEVLEISLSKDDTFAMGSGAVYPKIIPITQEQVPDFYMVRHEVTDFSYLNLLLPQVISQ
jgi:hypothetical protein